MGSSDTNFFLGFFEVVKGFKDYRAEFAGSQEI